MDTKGEIMISKELLSAVLETEVKTFKIENELIIYNDHYVINIYKLAHLCKEWSSKQKYYINSGKFDNSSGINSGKCFAAIHNPTKRLNSVYGSGGVKNDIVAVTENEAIFKACEWILKDDA